MFSLNVSAEYILDRRLRLVPFLVAVAPADLVVLVEDRNEAFEVLLQIRLRSSAKSFADELSG